MKLPQYNKNFNESIYDLEIEKVIDEIKKAKAKTVLLQFPDGIKSRAFEVVDAIEEKFNSKKQTVRVFTWLGACYGACDLPIQLSNRVDLVIQFGHNRFVKNMKGWK
ncbi:hypothetical protein COU57_00330 [Candidatus Pacearchaeota archaeon CG10_big_fil_rev_8_21_14_0_10_32_14]|nr:MAG: hypothetical protein COU57_00330 [Candidatus Pacearchaeota archaeon CG10_big_fil_rev_8_21_14_0_10_32_14]